MNIMHFDEEAEVTTDHRTTILHMERDSPEYITVYLDKGFYIVLSQDDLNQLNAVGN